MAKKLILYLDILGFKDLIKKEKPDKIYKKLTSYQETIKKFTKLPGNEAFGSANFSVINFSDSVVFYQNENDSLNGIYDLLIYSSFIYLTLLSKRIPVRGTITYGEFLVRDDASGFFFGEALINAYEMEKDGNFIGIILDSTVAEILSKGSIKDKKGNIHDYKGYFIKSIRRNNKKTWLLNPFCDVKGKIEDNVNKEDEWMVSLALHAVQFVYNCAEKYRAKKDFMSREAGKYYNTLVYMENMLGKKKYLKIIKTIEKHKKSNA